MRILKEIIKQAVPQSVVRQKLNKKNCILFTFDDGPHPVVTEQVLDVLDQYQARALFFITASRIKNAPNLLNQILNRNHGIGNHSAAHKPPNKMSLVEIMNDISACQKEIFSNCGIITEHFRPPYGIVTTKLLAAARLTRHKIIRWSLDVGEYSYMRNATPNDLANNFFNKLHDKAVVAAHDDFIYGVNIIPDFLRIVLPELANRGYDLSSGLSSMMSNHSNAIIGNF